MVNRRILGIHLAVVLVVLAGCGAPVADSVADSDDPPSPDTPETNDTEESTVTVSTAQADEELPVDIYLTYERVQTLVDSDASMPEVRVLELEEVFDEQFADRSDPFYDAMNMTGVDVEFDGEAEGASGVAQLGTVAIDPRNASEADIEQVLVHEYFHAIQFAEQWVPEASDLDRDTATSTDYQHVTLMLIEGGAVWVTDQYSTQYQSLDVVRQSERMATAYEGTTGQHRLLFAPYYHGFLYVDDRIDDPTAISELYGEDHPVTTEQVLHGLDPAENPPASLSVDATGTDDWNVERTDRLGELVVRIILESGVNDDLAATAAAGWGNDHLVGFQDDSGEWGFTWILHWDTVTDADDFESAFEASLADRTDADADRTTIDRQDDRTVVVTIGPDGFRAAVDVSGTGGTYDVTMDDSTTDSVSASGPLDTRTIPATG